MTPGSWEISVMEMIQNVAQCVSVCVCVCVCARAHAPAPGTLGGGVEVDKEVDTGFPLYYWFSKSLKTTRS